MELSENDAVRKMYLNIRNYCEEMKCKNALKALPYAYEKHNGVERVGGDPYIIHPLQVAWQGILIGVNSDIEIASALLHDVPEDCNTMLEDLDIDPLIKDITINFLNVHQFESAAWDKHERNRRYFDKIATNEIATMIKFGDTDNNLSTMMRDFSPEKILKNVIEKREFMYPLLDYASKIYESIPGRKEQIAFYSKRIHAFVEQADAHLGDKSSSLHRTKHIA